MQPAGPPESLVVGLKYLLRPLVRVLIRHGITLGYLSALLKQVYVDVARDFRVSGKRLTDSRISLITGVHRKDVKRLREEARPMPVASKHASIGAQVVARWTGDPEFLDSDGNPKDLERHAEGSFDALVERVNTDMRPRTLLDEWLRSDMVSLDSAGRVHLNTEAFVPSRDYDDLAYYFGRNLHDHIAAADHNLEGLEPPLLERSTHYSGLTPEAVSKLEKLSRSIGMDTLMRINREAMKHVKTGKDQSGATERFTFGVYFFRDEDQVEETDIKDVKKKEEPRS